MLLFKLGGAEGVIGLALQGAGMFGGGGKSQTQYVADDRAKYEADMIGYQSTLDNQRWAEQILNGQISAQTSIDDYSFNLQNIQLDKEMSMSDQSIQQQYNASLFQNSLSRMTNEVNRYSQLTQYNQAKLNSDYQDAMTQRTLSLKQAGNQANLANSTLNNSLSQSNLGVAGSAENARHELANRGLDLQQSALQDANTQLGYKQQGLDLNKMDLSQKLAEGTQTLDTQEAKGNINASLQEAGAESQRGNMIREMLRNVAKSDQEFSVYQTLMGANGQGAGTQSGQIQQDRLNQATQDKGGILDQYAQSMGQAGLTKSTNQQDVNLGRRNLAQQVGLQGQGILNQEGMLNLQKNDLSRQQASLTNAQRAENIQNSQSAAQREIQMLGLQGQQGYDVFSKSLLPDMQFLGEGLASQWNRTNQNYSQDVQNGVNELGYQTQNGISDLQGQSSLSSANNAYDQLSANYNLQGQSAIAAYLANMGNTQMQKSAGLNQIAGNTYSQLAQYGNYAQPITGSTGGGGGGFNPGALSGMFDSAMSLMNSGKGSTKSNTPSANPYAFTGGWSPTGNEAYSGNTMNGTINW